MSDSHEAIQNSSPTANREERPDSVAQFPPAKRQKKDEVERQRATRACDRCKQ
jgi:hypothetical protein